MKKTLIITESQEQALVGLLTESQESESQKQAIKYLMTNLNWDKDRANQFIRVDLRNDVTSLRDKQIAKFTLGVTRMFVDGQLRDANTIANLNATLKLLSVHLNEYDRNLNGLSAQDLISRFEKTRQDNLENDKNEINSMQFGVSDYDIVSINSFEEAQKYYIYTNPNSRWCLTHMEDMFESYTSGGINQIYFCLKHGFENIKPVVGDGAPLDEYGLSMISVIVNENGELAYCTCRWNHDNGGSDSVMTAKEVSKVVNVNFYEVFKPNNKWRDMVNDAMERVRNGEDLGDIFDAVGDFSEGFYKVELNGKWNFINQEGGLVSNQWFDYVYSFNAGFAAVELNGKWNFINQEGELLSNQWFDYVDFFKEGFVKVVLNGKYNFINQEGELLSNQWFDYVSSFNEGFAKVELNGERFKIDVNGKLYMNESKQNKKTLIITESQEQALVHLLKQPTTKKGKPYVVNPEKVLVVKRFLDVNFKKGNIENIGPNGLPCKQNIVAMLSSTGDVLKNMQFEELHDLLIDRFKNMFLDKDERNCFLKQVMNDWFNDKIGVFGTLSVNSIKSNTLFENTVKKYINEELSIADTVKEISDDIIIKIKEELKNIKTEKDKSNQGVYTSKFHINSEINGKKILVSGTYYNFLNNEVLQKVGNQYDIDYAASVCDGKGINFIFINCYAISGTLQTKSLYGQIYRKVNHIYQGNCGSNVVTNNIKEYSIASGYIYSDNPIDRALSNVIYLNYKFEQDGYINELYGYLKNFGPKPQWKNIYESSTYKAISDFENYIKYITENINNEELIYKCKEKYNLTPQRLIKLGHNSLDRIKRKIAKVLIKYNNDMMNEGINFLYKNCKNKANMYIS